MDCSLNNTEVVKKKRGRKKKSELLSEESKKEVEENPLPKKRGRKPKGGKLIKKPIENNDQTNPLSNVILHLKCSLNDIKIDNFSISDPLSYNPIVPPNIMTYNDNENQYTDFQNDKLNENKDLAYETNDPKELSHTCPICISRKGKDDIIIDNNDEDDDISFKDINQKLKEIKIQLYKNTNPDNKSACFWCTYDFDNTTCYIPKYELDGEIAGYGSFCRPECATAYLLKENIDDSCKFERYQLLNKIYGKVYNYEKNIKPSPDPYYLLDKYYGNLSIQEYRKLLKSDHMLMVLEKPLTRVLPELHEELNDNNDNNGKFSLKNTGYKVKRQSEKQKGPSKNEIMKEKFGFV
tara:strand:- start:1622 stop:2674 length:1053 start_codon:yes stop_codon:yes gene_type:complete